MIITYITLRGITIRNNFDTLTQALAFARSQEIGTSFVIKEGNVTLAKGRIEFYMGVLK